MRRNISSSFLSNALQRQCPIGPNLFNILLCRLQRSSEVR